MSTSNQLPRDTSPSTRRNSLGGSLPTNAKAGLVITLMGLSIFTIGTKPEWFGWSRGPRVGHLQISIFLFGLAVICFGGLVGLLSLWGSRQRTIVSDIGLRLVGTGYVISFFSGLADELGLGAQSAPQTSYFGHLQATGVLVGQVITAIGFLLLIPYPSRSAQK